MAKDFDLSIEYVPIHALAAAPRNPKDHDLGALHESMGRFGFVAPITINETTGRMVAGHGRLETLLQAQNMGMKPPKRIKVREDGEWLVPVIRGISFATDKEAEAYLLADNRIVELGGYHDDELAAMLKEMNASGPEALAGTGFGSEDIDALIRKLDGGTPMFAPLPSPSAMAPPPLTPTEEAAKSVAGTSRAGVVRPDLSKPNPIDALPEVPPDLQEMFDAKEDTAFSGDSNVFEIPDLIPDRLVPRIPDKLDTFAGDATPDDGETDWFYIYGSYSVERIAPFGDRVIVSFFTDDARFESWWELPAYHVAKLWRAGVRRAVVPDFSNWDGDPRIIHLWNIYRAQWLARYMQEVGFQIIPRIIAPDRDDPIKNIGALGIPLHAPVVAMQLQAAYKGDDAVLKDTLDGYRCVLEYVQPESIIVYANQVGREMCERWPLPVPEVRFIDTFMTKRSKKMQMQAKNEDADLRQLKEAERARKRRARRGGGGGESDNSDE